MQKSYELMVLLHPDLEIDVETQIAKIEGLVQAAGGKVTRTDNWGKKRLAYRIARQDFAIYVYFEIQLPTSGVNELERSLLITEEVVRHILVVHNEFKPRSADKPAGDKLVPEKSGTQKVSAKAEAEAADSNEEGRE